jgi:hypothetical protein
MNRRLGRSWVGKRAREGLMHPPWTAVPRNTTTNILNEKLNLFQCSRKFKFDQNKGKLNIQLQVSLTDPGILFGGGSTNSVEDRSHRERGSGDSSP